MPMKLDRERSHFIAAYERQRTRRDRGILGFAFHAG
jgi:hypothetical protein